VCLQKRDTKEGFWHLLSSHRVTTNKVSPVSFVEKFLQSSAKSTLLVGNQAAIYHSIGRARLTDKPKKVDQDRYPAASAALSLSAVITEQETAGPPQGTP
jgi:hypothetical protein